MPAEIITFGIQKGGSSKTTTTGVTAYLLAEEGYKVLVVDMDSQGNVTDLLAQKNPLEFQGQTVLEAIKEGNPKPYILEVNEKLHVLPSDDFLATLPRWLYTKRKGSPVTALRDALDDVRKDYDFILIDTPPSLGELMTNAITASNYVCVMVESSKWAAIAVPRFLDTIKYAKDNVNPRLRVLGMLRTRSDSNVRRADPDTYIKLMGERYPQIVFKTVIKRKSTTGRLPLQGFENNKELNSALKDYRKYFKEFKQRLGVEK